MGAKFEKTRHPGIYKRGGRYVVRWRDRGVEQKESFRTLAEAKEAQGRRRQPGGERAYSKSRFDDYALAWLDTFQGRNAGGLAESTRASYRRSTVQWAVPFFKRQKLADVRPPDVRAYVKHMQKEGVSSSSIRKHMAPLKAMFAEAYEDGLIASNPTQIRLKLAKTGNGKVKAMTEEEQALVLAAVPDAWRPFFTFLAQTGVRISEALAVTWADVDLGTAPHVKVRRQLYRGEIKRLKSRHSDRDIPLSVGMVQALRERRASGYAGEDAPVFCTTRGGPLDAHNVRHRVLAPTVQALGLGWVGFHTFRHTCASVLFAHGRSIKQVQGWLGHADPGFTLRTYVHLLDEGLGSADFFDQVVSAPPVARAAAAAERDPSTELP
jgi:integrase